MSCELDCDDLKDVGFEELVRKMVVKTEDGCFALRVIDEGEGGGGSYTFPSNHGNTAYVATGGNDATGTVGNISKPFETLQAAIDDLDGGTAGQVIILSSSSFGQQITSYDANTNPYVMVIRNFSDSPIEWTGTGNRFVGQFTIETNSNVQFNITGGGTFTVDDYMNINCRALLIPGTHNCDINHNGIIKCDVFTVNSNTNNPSLSFGIIKWAVSINPNEPFTYQSCNPMVLKILADQGGTDDPGITVFENTTNASYTFTRTGNGTYELEASSAVFNSGKTMVTVGAPNYEYGGAGDASIGKSIVSTSVIQFTSYWSDSFPADEVMKETAITIEIYP